MRRRPAGLAAALLAALALAACGDDEPSGPPAAPPVESPAPDAEGDRPSEGSERDRRAGRLPGAAGSFDAQAIYERASEGVVTVLSVFGRGGGLLRGDGPRGGQGSGFVLNQRGEVATNAHVVTEGEGSSIKRAREVYVEFADRNRVKARIVGYDPNADVALLRVEPRGLKLVPLTLADGRGLEVGQPVAAIGSPFGEEQSLSVGVISATDRSIESLTAFEIQNAIQTDAAINRGNSGGPLLDARGRVIGINQQIKSTSGGGEGVGFAVPVAMARRSIEELRRRGRVSYAYIGVSSQALYPQLARRLGLDVHSGSLIAEVVDGGPADRAGLRSGGKEIRFQGGMVKVGGDVIVAIAGRRLVGENDLSRIIAGHRPGETIAVDILRDGRRRKVQLKLGERPAGLPRER